MADLYLKALESERKALWATCRLKGLARDTPERQRNRCARRGDRRTPGAQAELTGGSEGLGWPGSIAREPTCMFRAGMKFLFALAIGPVAACGTA
jgi:hypothetical protein